MQALKEAFTDPFVIIALVTLVPFMILHVWALLTGRYDENKDD